MDRYVWLICWFLQAVVSAEIWKHEVNGSIHYQEKRKNIAEWMTSSDLAYLCTIYIHSYKKWKKEAEMKFATPGGKLTRQDHKELNKLGRYKPDGISSKEGEDKLYDIQRHYVYEIADKPDARERFNTKFWEYYDKNILPMMLKDAHKERPAKPILEETPEYKALVEKKEKRKLDAKHFAMV